MVEHVDVLIIGAGLSGIGMACHLRRDCPGKRLAIWERRQAMGGTWDLFRYPGVRSDSDMFTMGYVFSAWMQPQVLADGSSINAYIAQTARDHGVDKEVHYGLQVRSADWRSAEQHWVVTALHEASGELRHCTCRFLVSCTGYYYYDQGYLPQFPGAQDFKGQCIHPQFWPEGLDYRGKKVVIIGSGATAVTLVPAMAATAAQVTMLQRSPTYYLSVPGYESLIQSLSTLLPRSWIYGALRRGNIVGQRLIFLCARRWPNAMRRMLLSAVQKELGEGADMRHFTPRYMPWDQRLCVVPRGDFFKALRSGKASVLTDEIDHFTAQGLRLQSGAALEADIVITATGLQLQTFGGMAISVDGRATPANRLLSYKAVLMQDLPNMAFVLGYTNASWTLKADMASRYICRLLNHMDAKGLATVTPHADASETTDANCMSDLGSGYVQRGAGELARQGRSGPWRVQHAYERDRIMLLKQPVEDGLLRFTPRL
jgi:cation diffusion facilitator CzcD-associated flavoprotein CzcO